MKEINRYTSTMLTNLLTTSEIDDNQFEIIHRGFLNFLKYFLIIRNRFEIDIFQKNFEKVGERMSWIRLVNVSIEMHSLFLFLFLFLFLLSSLLVCLFFTRVENR